MEEEEGGRDEGGSLQRPQYKQERDLNIHNLGLGRTDAAFISSGEDQTPIRERDGEKERREEGLFFFLLLLTENMGANFKLNYRLNESPVLLNSTYVFLLSLIPLSLCPVLSGLVSHKCYHSSLASPSSNS